MNIKTIDDIIVIPHNSHPCVVCGYAIEHPCCGLNAFSKVINCPVCNYRNKVKGHGE
jgi:hypothetical protein